MKFLFLVIITIQDGTCIRDFIDIRFIKIHLELLNIISKKKSYTINCGYEGTQY